MNKTWRTVLVVTIAAIVAAAIFMLLARTDPPEQRFPQGKVYHVLLNVWMVLFKQAERHETPIPEFNSSSDIWMRDPAVTATYLGEGLALLLAESLLEITEDGYLIEVPRSVVGRTFDELRDEELVLVVTRPDNSYWLGASASGLPVMRQR